MPKAGKEKTAKPLRHNPLAEQIIEAEASRSLRRTPHPKARKSAQDEEEENDVIPSNITKKVLDVVQAQKADDEEDDFPGDNNAPGYVGSDGVQSDGEMDDIEVDEDGFIVSQNATEEDEQALALFLPGSNAPKAGLSLADVVLQKIQEQKNETATTRE